ncbi:hypothetical protein ACFXGA_05870, partial [Actinosynnema sp. NPDC059335]
MRGRLVGRVVAGIALVATALVVGGVGSSQAQPSGPEPAAAPAMEVAAPLGYRQAVGRNADGRIEVFARGGDGALWHIWQTAPNNGWSGWQSLGGYITSPPVVMNNADGRLEVFVVGGDNALWHIWQTAPNNG